VKRALILDFGGVISRTLFETHDETERALGLAPGTLTWRGPFDPPTDPLWQAMQRGELSERDYWLQRSREVGSLLGETWDAMETLVQRARGADPDRIVRPETAALVRQAQVAGIRLAILYTGVLKPDPKAYLGCLQALGLQAGEAVFVDDQPRNVDGARRLGIPTVAFDVMHPAASCEEARQLLGLTG
jgi:putative hydrolase of the HAD superfamily